LHETSPVACHNLEFILNVRNCYRPTFSQNSLDKGSISSSCSLYLCGTTQYSINFPYPWTLVQIFYHNAYTLWHISVILQIYKGYGKQHITPDVQQVTWNE